MFVYGLEVVIYLIWYPNGTSAFGWFDRLVYREFLVKNNLVREVKAKMFMTTLIGDISMT